MRFVFTGPAMVDGIHFKRDNLVQLAEEKGHQVSKSVKPGVDFLVVDEDFVVNHATKTSATTKMRDSAKYQIPRMTPRKFLELVGFL